MPSAVSPPRLSGSKRRRPARVLFPSLVTVIALWYLLHTRERAAGLTPSHGADSTGQKRNTHSFDEGDAHEQSSLRQARTTHPRSPSPPPLSSSWALEAEQAAWRVPPKYSTHTCNGQKFYDNWHMTTCKFDNICLNASTGEFEYYVDPSAIPGGLSQGVFIDFDAVGNALIEFPDKMLNPGHSLIDSNVSWRPVVRRTRFPKLGPRVKWAPSSQALIAAMPPPLLWNFGHVMFDVLVPVFNMQQQFGLYDPSAQILIPFAVNGTESSLRYWLPTLINTKDRDKSVLHLTYHSPAAWTREYAAQVLGDKGDGLVCFHATLAGTGMLNRQQADVDALPYRQAVVRHLGIREEAPRRPVITILNKKGRRMVENFREVAKIIRTRYPHSQVNVVDFGKQPDLTMRQQVQLMADTSILISPCGGLATVLTFLRPQSTAIVLNYWNTIQQRSMQMEDNYYQHMEYLDFQYMPVNPADYEDTFDRPWCEIHENGTRLEDAHSVILGSLVHCNIHFKREGLDRLLNYVDNAMLRWAARWGRYDVLKGGTRQSYSPLTAEVVVDGTGAAGGSDALSAAAS